MLQGNADGRCHRRNQPEPDTLRSNFEPQGQCEDIKHGLLDHDDGLAGLAQTGQPMRLKLRDAFVKTSERPRDFQLKT